MSEHTDADRLAMLEARVTELEGKTKPAPRLVFAENPDGWWVVDTDKSTEWVPLR